MAAGANVVAISPHTLEKSLELIEARKLKIPILRDEGNVFAAAYGLRWELPDDLRELYLQFGVDLAESNGEGSWSLPVPARYIIGTDGIIRYARFDADYTKRPEPEDTVDALRSL